MPKVRPDLHVTENIAVTAGQSQEINLSSILSAGNIKTLSFRFRASAATGANADCFQEGAVSRPTSVVYKINGVEFEEQLNPLEIDLEEYLQGFRRREGEATLPYRYTFAESPN